MPQVNLALENSRLRAQAEDPNEMRCLIENRPKEDAGVDIAHVLPRHTAGNAELMRSIEWAWNMDEGTLNLDIHRNLLFLSSRMKSLYDAEKWALLPEEHVVDQFFAEPVCGFSAAPLPRSRFPRLEDKTFRYTFLPLSDMSAFGNGINRHHEAVTPTSPDAFTTHVFPFATLPQLTSHVHPTFVIMHLADLIFNHSMNSFLQSLRRSNRTVGKVGRLYPAWARQASSWADVGPSFVTVPISENNEGVEGPEGDLDSGSSDGDSTCTPPYRLGYAPRIVRRPPYTRVKNHIAESDDPEEDEASQSELRRLHPETTERPAQYGWTKNSISEWARVCSDS